MMVDLDARRPRGVVGKPNAVNHGGLYDDVYEKTGVGWRFKKGTYWESKVDSWPGFPYGFTLSTVLKTIG